MAKNGDEMERARGLEEEYDEEATRGCLVYKAVM